MDVIDWLLESDPAIRWQVMRDLTGEPAAVIARERARVATEGWGSRLLALQGVDGRWGREVLPARDSAWQGDFPDPGTRALVRRLHGIALEDIGGFLGIEPDTLSQWETGTPDPSDERSERYRRALEWLWDAVGTLKPEWTSTTHTLLLLRDMGLDPKSEQARRAVAPVRDSVKWENEGQDYFAGEVEPCINGKAVAIGSYFGENVEGIVDRLLGEQLADGGWNCEAERGSVRSSFNTTISVLDGLLEYERATGSSAALSAARSRGIEYLLNRKLMRRLSTGELIDPHFTEFAYPTGWHYDVLWGLDHLRDAGVSPDERAAEAIELVVAKRRPDGRWNREKPHRGDTHFDMDEGPGEPSSWITLRALRVLGWYNAA